LNTETTTENETQPEEGNIKNKLENLMRQRPPPVSQVQQVEENNTEQLQQDQQPESNQNLPKSGLPPLIPRRINEDNQNNGIPRRITEDNQNNGQGSEQDQNNTENKQTTTDNNQTGVIPPPKKDNFGQMVGDKTKQTFSKIKDIFGKKKKN